MGNGTHSGPAETPRLDQRAFTELWPYAAFACFVVLYNSLLLRQGYIPSDDGYLQSVAQRILDGQRPYLDFYFLRTPLSVYLQAAFMALFGHSYTILTARLLCTAEVTGIALIVSRLYSHLSSSWEFCLLMISSYIVTTLLINFPWYSYDGLFFAVLSLYLLERRLPIWSGAAACLAALCKQNYALLVPLLAAIALLSRGVCPGEAAIKGRSIARMATGFTLVLGAYLMYILAIGAVHSFWNNVVSLPASLAGQTIGGFLFQDNRQALLRSAVSLLPVAALFFLSSLRWFQTAAAAAALAWIGFRLYGNVYSFVYFILWLNYLILAVVIGITWWRRRRGRNIGRDPSASLLAMAVGIQYISGFNYSGVLFAQMGAGVAFPFAYLAARSLVSSPWIRRVVPLAFLIAISALGVHHRYGTVYVYHEHPRSELTTPFASEKLRGITSTAANVAGLDALIAVIKSNTAATDSIFVFPQYPALYFLTGRRNPTAIDWYYYLEFNQSMLDESLSTLERTRPKLIFVNSENLPVRLSKLLSSSYELIPANTPGKIYLRRT